MSLAALKWASGLRGVTGAELRVALVLANHHNPDTGQCNPSLTTIAREADLFPRWALRCVQALRAKGHVDRVAGGGRTHTTSYLLPVPLRGGETVAKAATVSARKQWPPESGNSGEKCPETVANFARRNGKETIRETGGAPPPRPPGASKSSLEHAPPPRPQPPSEPEPAAAEPPGLALERVPPDVYERIRAGLGRIGRPGSLAGLPPGARELPPEEVEAREAKKAAALAVATADMARRAASAPAEPVLAGVAPELEVARAGVVDLAARRATRRAG